jgi:hypothetical protein
MPQQVEKDIKVIDQFLDVAVREKSGAEGLRGFIQAPVAFRNIYVAHLRAERGSAQTNICSLINLSVHDCQFLCTLYILLNFLAFIFMRLIFF